MRNSFRSPQVHQDLDRRGRRNRDPQGQPLGRHYFANEKLNIASIGVCGQGESNLGGVGGENIVALCDADERRADPAGKRFPKAKRYADFRKMFDEMQHRLMRSWSARRTTRTPWWRWRP